jgi:hypothetical protein
MEIKKAFSVKLKKISVEIFYRNHFIPKKNAALYSHNLHFGVTKRISPNNFK